MEGTTFWGSIINASTFTDLINGMKEIAPIVLVSCVLPLALLRKGLDFIKGMVYGA